ncbi:hypothetical protein GH714_028470 [Hevea brasiliensis]|uniref:Cytochrome b561 domain-containing protein n=2 Tax=Hevea brasiliensis TaxID=3981 RepID=A0A6A6MNU6_HEVBR|nr:hypothetical protein GH714_028470 [Hevea brasiliensis]
MFHQYQVVGRGLPTENDEHPKIYRMKLWATNEVRAKSKFWYFLRKLKKVKKSNGQVLAINEIFEKNPTKIKNYGIWLRYQSRTGYHNMYKEYRDTTLNGAVEQMYNEMASRHRVRFPCIQIIKTATIPAKLCKRESTKQFHNSKIKFPLVFKKVENVQSVVLWICAGAISPYLLSWKLIAWWSGMRVYCQSCGLLSHKMKSDVALHGVLLWVSLGFLAPLGILIIRISHREEGGSRRKVLLYLHVILQVLLVLLATSGAIMSIKSFENSFDNNHQRIGLALYGAVWVQAVIGFLRPLRGSKRRSTWYFLHWILGTLISLVGIINIYTGLEAYRKKISAKTRIWTILFTSQVSFMAFFYLFQDKWEYMQKQGVILGNIEPITPTNITAQSDDTQKVLVPEPCAKRNALRNLFD